MQTEVPFTLGSLKFASGQREMLFSNRPTKTFLYHEVGQCRARSLDTLPLHDCPSRLLEEFPEEIVCLRVEAFDFHLAR